MSQESIEDLSTKATKEELKEAVIDEWGAKDSKDGRMLLKAPQELKGYYSVKEGTKIICNSAFSFCSSLAKVVIPNSIVCINGNPFKAWHGKLECLSPSFVYENNILFNKDKSKIISFRNQKQTSYFIPNSVTSIGDGAFFACNSLAEVVIPNSVTNIGDRAFSFCSSLAEVVIPNSVTSIGEGAFEYCNFPCDLRQELISRFGDKIFKQL